MTLDLREELDRATSTLAPTGDLVGRARAAGRRRLLLHRLVNVAAGATAVAVLAVGITSIAPQWRQATPYPGASTASTAPPADVEAALAAVSMPDPAPGFPYRLTPDPAPRLVTLDDQQGWVRLFSLAARPETTVTDANGVVSGEANGPEAVVNVSTFPLRESDSQVGGHPIVARPTIAGTRGIQVEFEVGGAPVVGVYFQKGGFTVDITGIEGATPDQLITLGNALTGLEGSASIAASMAEAGRTAEAQQRCHAALAQEPGGTEILAVSATTVDAVRKYHDDARAAALSTEPWASLKGSDTAGWCTLKAGDTFKIIAAAGRGASITFVTSTQPLDSPGPAGPELQ